MPMGRTWDPTVPAIILACGLVAGVVASTGGLEPGGWRGTLATNGQTVRLEMRLDQRGSHIRLTTDVPTGELEGFDAASFSKSGAPVRIAWKRDAGSFVLDGTGGRHPAGSVRFEPSASFRESWRGLGLEPLGDGDLFTMAISGVQLAVVQDLVAEGADHLDAGDVIELARDPDAMRWVKELKGRGAPIRLRDVFLLRNHGLSPGTYRDYLQSGVEADVEEIVRLHDRGVDAAYVKDLLQAGVRAHDLEGIERLHAHGVAADYVARIGTSELRETGVDGITRLHDQGVGDDYVHDVTASGLTGVTLEGIVRLHAHGVPADYVRIVADYGPGDRAVDDAILLHDSGVSTEFLRSRASSGTARPTTESTIRSWARGGEDSTPNP